MKKKNKISHLNNTQPFIPTEDKWYHKARSFLQWKQVGLEEPFRQEIISKMIEWAEQKDSFKMAQFTYAYGIPYMTFIKWTKIYPDIGKIYKEIKLHLGNKREIGALKRELCPSTAHFTMAFYCPIWEEQEERKARLRQPIPTTADINVVELPAVEKTNEVPIKPPKDTHEK